MDPLLGAQTEIARTCLTYLSSDEFEKGLCPTDEKMEIRLQEKLFFGGVVDLLLGKGADVAAKTNFGETALHQSVRNGHDRTIQLLEKRADERLGERGIRQRATGGFAQRPPSGRPAAAREGSRRQRTRWSGTRSSGC
ncbi:MAG: hypothetical protein M1813_004449 [Trichoglossum hirsutum]|nr:MAG: hypothetical protein M1813_004449 [Trichoglossum hirsutum]